MDGNDYAGRLELNLRRCFVVAKVEPEATATQQSEATRAQKLKSVSSAGSQTKKSRQLACIRSDTTSTLGTLDGQSVCAEEGAGSITRDDDPSVIAPQGRGYKSRTRICVVVCVPRLPHVAVTYLVLELVVFALICILIEASQISSAVPWKPLLFPCRKGKFDKNTGARTDAEVPKSETKQAETCHLDSPSASTAGDGFIHHAELLCWVGTGQPESSPQLVLSLESHIVMAITRGYLAASRCLFGQVPLQASNPHQPLAEAENRGSKYLSFFSSSVIHKTMPEASLFPPSPPQTAAGAGICCPPPQLFEGPPTGG
ncbi:hypothetical protein NM208_g16428 [Fusarium decemcellulare]|uniref:Uncharacterized protein n=1 Tax=Fusarium decemcellulare TaxID=57161 RepID=A0ACC1RCS6_9HYPO|nr:hypothetical protein NM208_g16428 [Fusarium decemcellulare]